MINGKKETFAFEATRYWAIMDKIRAIVVTCPPGKCAVKLVRSGTFLFHPEQEARHYLSPRSLKTQRTNLWRN